MSGIVLDATGQPVAGEARQQVSVQAEQHVMAPIQQSGAVAGVAMQLMSQLMVLAKEKHPKEYLDFIKDLYNEERNREARLAFNDAMARSAAEFPPIKKSKRVKFKAKKEGAQGTHYAHEELADVVRATKPIMGKYGLVATFRAKNAIGAPVAVTCVITHALGHVDDSNHLEAGRDDSGNKNNIQAIKSTTSYLMRYTLLAALGLSAEGDDDDGETAEQPAEPKVTEEQVEAIEKAIAALPNSHITNDTKGLLFKYADLGVEAFEDLPARLFDDCMRRIAEATRIRTENAAKATAKAEQEAEAARLADEARAVAAKGGQRTMI